MHPRNQLPIDFTAPPHNLPPQEKFPLTIKAEGRQIKKTIEGDIEQSAHCLIVTGFTSLSKIIETFGIDLLKGKQVCTLFGVEPQPIPRRRWKEVPLQQEVKDYWLEKGISPFQCGAVVKTIANIESGQLTFKILDKLHAKLYVTESHATLGSSNFSHSGLSVQHEANIRVADSAQPEGGYQYKAIKAIAEYYWQRGKPYSAELIELLNQLLIVVDWQEALARAITELLDGEYVKAYLKTFEQPGATRLWPSQAMGIHQGLQILQEVGSVLVADPTGSGKTKMITVLQLALLNWLWETGRGAKVNSLVITPPIVMEAWKREQLALGRLLPDPLSQGILSLEGSAKHRAALEAVRLANLLVIDEAHNYLNKTSTRSLSVSTHRAEFIILSTATPINKRAEDLLRLVQLLDPDNLGDEELAQFKALYSKQPKELEESDTVIQQLKSYIWKFTLRRTKTDLNLLIKKEPDKYLNELNERCHYPEQKHHFYFTGETEEDIRIAREIDDLSASLKGLIYLRKITFPKSRNLDSREKRDAYIQARLKTAKGLSRYRVQASLRSSRAALVEMIEGTKAAEIFASLPTIHKETGDIIKTLSDMKEALPKYPKEWDVLPDWLRVEAFFHKACEEEIKTYGKISALAKSMSDSRERTKALALLDVAQKRSLVVAFDHTIITLYCLKKLLADKTASCYVVSGTDTAAKQIVLEQLALGSSAKNVVALCSDAVSEGVNLQAAPVVVMLDMPSVLRLAEQRIGRIDRLNSPHNKIHIYWPDDSPVFRLKADKKLIRTAAITKQLMGSNLALPEEFSSRYEDLEAMSAKAVVEELKVAREDQENEWAGMKDAFEAVRLLIEGPDVLLTEKEYQRMIGSSATVRCKLSFVKAAQRWAFIALRSSKESVSRWLFIDESENVITDFSAICNLLRQRLDGSEKAPFNETELKHFIGLFRQKERTSLPHKKRRALNVAEAVLQRQLKEETKKANSSMINLISDVLEAFKPSDKEVAIDYSRFSVLWLDILSGWLKDWRSERNYRRWLSLEDLIKRRPSYFFSQIQIERILVHLPLTDPLDLQIAACIVGVYNE